LDLIPFAIGAAHLYSVSQTSGVTALARTSTICGTIVRRFSTGTLPIAAGLGFVADDAVLREGLNAQGARIHESADHFARPGPHAGGLDGRAALNIIGTLADVYGAAHAAHGRRITCQIGCRAGWTLGDQICLSALLCVIGALLGTGITASATLKSERAADQ